MIQEKEPFKESTKNLMRPAQVEEMKGEISRLEGSLNAPPHISAQIQDPGEMRRQLKNLKSDLASQAPQPYGDRVDAARVRAEVLKQEILKGMPTDPEMRRNPAGATDKHRKWEQRNKDNILEWKNIQLNLHAGGDLDELADASDVANFEKFRPLDASHELNMHNEQIAGKVQHGPFGTELGTVITDEEKAILESVDPEVASSLALMNNAQRASVKNFVKNLASGFEVDKMGKKKREWTPEQKAKQAAAMAAGRKRADELRAEQEK
jgi:hypothetical protein